MPAAAFAAEGDTQTVAAGETYVVTEVTALDELVVEEGGTITGSDGRVVTLTVDGVELGQLYPTADALQTEIQPGTYTGDVVLTPTVPIDAVFQTNTYRLRTGLAVVNGAVVPESSVAAALLAGAVDDSSADGVVIDSDGAGFNGIHVTDSAYDITGATITLDGSGRSDFGGVAQGIVASGVGARVVVDDTVIDNAGVARGAITSTDGANLLVKNSSLSVADGVLPDDYVSTVDLTKMMDAPWMLGTYGNNRATLLLGDGTRAAYVNTALHAEHWGVLSTDTGSHVQLTAINSDVSTGDAGYGLYAIGNAEEALLGTSFDVADYIGIVTANEAGTVYFGDSSAENVAAYDAAREIGLTADDLASIDERSVHATSDRIGIMWHGAGSIELDGGTVFETGGTVFQDKGGNSIATIDIDGSEGATVSSAEGVIVQVMDNDDPGIVFTEDGITNGGVYEQPTGDVEPVEGWDVTDVAAASATVTNLSDVDLDGDFYNGARSAKNLVLNIDDSSVTGVISASSAIHENGVTTITADNWYDIGEVENTAQAAVNNGVIVDLAGDSVWTVEGTSYLTSLSVGADAAVQGAEGRDVVLTVDGVVTPLVAGVTYEGAIVVELAAAAGGDDSDGDGDTDVDDTDGTGGTTDADGTDGTVDDGGDTDAGSTATDTTTTATSTGSLATTGGGVAVGAVVSGLLMLLAGAGAIFLRRRMV